MDRIDGAAGTADRRSGRPLRVLVGLNRLWLAGAELNAVDMGRAMRERGHDVQFFAEDEPDHAMLDIAEGHAFKVHLLPPGRTLSFVRPLQEIVRRERIDLVHAYYQRFAMVAFAGP